MDNQSEIEKALQAPIDYSDSFSNKVLNIKAELERVLNTELQYAGEMNYSAGQRLTFYLNDKCEFEKPTGNISIAVKIYISSKGPFYAIRYQRLVGKNEWENEMNLTKCSEKLQELINTNVASALKSESLIELSGRLLNEVVVGKFTELDNCPATLFQVLFSELEV